jgi:DNA-binding response OmpR family regulator
MGGADRYLVKPCSMEELLEAVRQMLGEPAQQ